MPINSEVKTSVLTENTAQSVFNHLKHLENNRQEVLTRWVWELLQNARDTSAGAEDSLTTLVNYDSQEVVFLHNGSPFKEREIAHLIYHGSTKIEDAGTIGQYGSGFLTTHLLSSAIDISGQVESGEWFEFRIDRRATSVDDLRQAMDEAAANFNPSLTAPTENLPEGFTTQFRYPMVGHAADVVEDGLKTLTQCAPLVVSFNAEFSSIRVNSRGVQTQFTVVDREKLRAGEIEKITVAKSHNGNQESRQYLVARGKVASVAIPTGHANGYEECLALGDVPRLFLGFPLVGTQNFGFPAIINSLRFTPTEERDGVYLGQNMDAANRGNQENQSIIEEACDLLVGLLEFTASSGYRIIHLLANIPPVQSQRGLNLGWLRETLEGRLIRSFKKTPAVHTLGGGLLSPKATRFPYAGDEPGVLPLWELLSEWSETASKLPMQSEAVGWYHAVKSWTRVTDQDALLSDGVIDVRKLAVGIDAIRNGENLGKLDDLQGLLSPNSNALEWLNKVHRYINDNQLRGQVEGLHIVLDQETWLDKMSSLYRDLGVAEELKDIAELLDWKIRQELRDVRLVEIADFTGKGDWDTAYVVSQLIQQLHTKAGSRLDAGFATASVRLFTWLAQQGRWEDLQGFPVFSGDSGAPSFKVIHLPRLTGDAQVPPLSPVKAWGSGLHEFGEIFPDERILSNAFHDALPDSAFWQEMNRRRLAVTDIIVKNDSTIERFFPDEPLPELEQGKKHETNEPFPTTDFLYRVEVMREVRNSRALAWPFWKFVSLWLSSNDCQGLQKVEAVCGSCGKPHQYYPAEWLERVREDGWIRRPNDVRETASPQSLARLVKENESQIDSFMSTPSVANLLEAMGISDFDMWMALRASTDAELKQQKAAFTDILRKTAGNLQPVREFVQDMQDDPGLVDHLTERREQRRVVQRNHELGAEVECKVKQALESLGFSVSRTGTGSDYAISADVGDVAGLQLSKGADTWLVEVKATRENSVRMTPTQARKARHEGDKWLLCVVPVEGETPNIEGMKFVAGVGNMVASLCDQLGDYEDMRDRIVSGIAGVELEIQSGTPKFRVNSNIWGNGQPLSVLAQLLSE